MKKMYFITLLMLSAALSFAQVPSYVPTNGLVGWWPFNGNANDESGNGNNGTVNGATLTTDRNGQVNKAYIFDGVDDVITVDSSVLQNAISATVSFWFQTTDFTLRFKNIFNKKRAPNGDGLNFTLTGDSCLAFINRAPSGPGQYFTPASQFTSIWNHGVVVFNNGNLTFYLNGIQKGSIVTPQGALVGNQRLYIGKGFDISPDPGGLRAFNGAIDDFGCWNRALTPQEITALYQGCNLNVTANPSTANAAIGANTSLVASGGTTYQWQTNPANNGWQNVNNNSTYSGATTASLSVNNVQLQNHQQQFRVISGSGNCVDTAYALINVTDTCINTVTTSISVTDTLIINAVLSGVNPPNNSNTLLVYPNPARTHITIDNGNFALMNGYTVRINNALGQTVFTQAVNQQQFFIDLSTWTGNGLYYLDLIDNSGNRIETKVIVVQ